MCFCAIMRVSAWGSLACALYNLQKTRGWTRKRGTTARARGVPTKKLKKARGTLYKAHQNCFLKKNPQNSMSRKNFLWFVCVLKKSLDFLGFCFSLEQKFIFCKKLFSKNKMNMIMYNNNIILK